MRETAVESHPFRKVREKGWGTRQRLMARNALSRTRAPDDDGFEGLSLFQRGAAGRGRPALH
jgi:hypothetical protein